MACSRDYEIKVASGISARIQERKINRSGSSIKVPLLVGVRDYHNNSIAAAAVYWQAIINSVT